jgi:type IV secretory pathway VirB10-like protein
MTTRRVEANSVVWVKQGSSRFWPCVARSLPDVAEDSLRRELQNQIRKIQSKHPDRVASGPSPTMVLVEFLGSHDYAWAQVHRVERFVGSKDAPDGPTVSTDEYHEAVNRLTGYSGAVKEAQEYCREQREAERKPKKARARDDGGDQDARQKDGRGDDKKRQRAEEKKKEKAKPPSNTAEVKAIAALNQALAKQMKAAEKEKPPAAVVSGRSRRASTAASSRATSQAEMTWMLQQQMTSGSKG